jgi:hypothetical protein
MSNADDVKRLACLPRCPGCKGLLLTPVPVAFTTERRSGQRALNRVLGQRPASPRERTAARKIFTPNNLSVVPFLKPDSCHCRPPQSVKTFSPFCPAIGKRALPLLAGNNPLLGGFSRICVVFTRQDGFWKSEGLRQNRSKIPQSANSKEKRRRAAPGENESTDVPRTGVPQATSSFPPF